jgi:hypothetical protein
MPPWGPISRRELVAVLRRLGFDGPYPGGNHSYMVRGGQRVRIPNPHAGDISVGLLGRMLDQAGVSRDEWERA